MLCVLGMLVLQATHYNTQPEGVVVANHAKKRKPPFKKSRKLTNSNCCALVAPVLVKLQSETYAVFISNSTAKRLPC
jgi:hypothetical protein